MALKLGSRTEHAAYDLFTESDNTEDERECVSLCHASHDDSFVCVRVLYCTVLCLEKKKIMYELIQALPPSFPAPTQSKTNSKLFR